MITQPLEALYQVSPGRGLTPAVEAMFRMQPPPRAFMRRYDDLACMIDRAHVDADDTLEVACIDVLQRRGRQADAGVVDHDVQRPSSILDGRHGHAS